MTGMPPEAGGGNERTAARRAPADHFVAVADRSGSKPKEKEIGAEYNLEETACSSARGRFLGAAPVTIGSRTTNIYY
jgi:hypothetical protein